MAIRPENHIVGDKAVRKISDTLISEEWTISTPESDKSNSTTPSWAFLFGYILSLLLIVYPKEYTINCFL